MCGKDSYPVSAPYAFVSYRSTEYDFARSVACFLRKQGQGAWVDKLGGILPGDDWVAKLEAGVDHAAVIIPILSPAYMQSRYCLAELQRAISQGKPVIPVMQSPTDVPLPIIRTQHIDFTDPTQFDQKLAELGAALARYGMIPQPPAQADDPCPETGIVAPLRQLPDRLLELDMAASKAQQTLDASKKRQAQRVKSVIDDLNEKLDLIYQQLQLEHPQNLLGQRQIKLLIHTVEQELDEWEQKLKRLSD
ncbi:MAG: TIR domain-containing protein [Anaerolineae bacterium]|nr:TIR domain-containing protein [Anaerolineae bacterium]